MKIIVGLGNPGKELKDSRHNLGFMVVDKLTQEMGNVKWENKEKFKAEICQVESLLLVKPQTFMNASGIAVKKILQYHNKTTTTLEHYNNLYIVHDDLDIELGEYKIQFGKGPRQHNGVLSVEKELGTKDFWRVRLGIGKKEAEKKECLLSGKDYVLEKFSQEEKEVLDGVIDKVIKKLFEKIKR